jgi:hypothetical protein
MRPGSGQKSFKAPRRPRVPAEANERESHANDVPIKCDMTLRAAVDKMQSGAACGNDLQAALLRFPPLSANYIPYEPSIT